METNATPSESQLDLGSEKRVLGDKWHDVYNRVDDLLYELRLPDFELRPRDCLTVRDDAVLNRVKLAIERFRGIPERRRVAFPALRHAVAKLELAAGEYLTAWKGFCSTAAMVTGPADKAVAHFNAFRAAFERKNWDSALESLLAAAQADPRFEIIPLSRFQPQRLLGGGSIGISILCKSVLRDELVVVKAFWKSELLRDIDEAFDEIRSLAELDHPNILRVFECGYVDAINASRPFAAMEYVAGKSLENLIREEGTLASKDVLAIAGKVASALHAAHMRNIVHRTVKPGNILVNRKDDQWEVKVVDFGMEVRDPDIELAQVSIRSTIAASLLGTYGSAAPEQLGTVKPISVGPACDIYGLARTCCYALFQTPRPNKSQFSFLPKIITDLLEHCLETDPDNRPRRMKIVIEDLQRVGLNLQVSTRYVPVAGKRWSDERNDESPVERRRRMIREAEQREYDYGDERRDRDRFEREDRRDSDKYDPDRGGGNKAILLVVTGILLLTATVVSIYFVLNDDRKKSASNEQATDPKVKKLPDAKQVAGPGVVRPAASRKPVIKESPLDPNQVYVFCSDMKRSGVENGPWPVTRHGRLGDPANNLIRVNGETFPNGISMHPPNFGSAKIQFNLKGKGKRFRSHASIGDMGLQFGNGVFSVHGDGKELWRSEPVNKPGQMTQCDIDVRGVEILELRTSTGGPCTGLHMCWLNPRILTEKTIAPDLLPKPTNTKGWVYLSDLDHIDSKDGPWPVKKNGKLGDNEKEIVVDGEPSPKGIGMHPPNMGSAEMLFNLDCKYSRLKGKVALNDSASPLFGPVVFEVLVDNKRVWQSDPINKAGQALEFDMDVGNATTLKIQTVSAMFSHGLHAVWVEPMLKLKGTKP